MTFKFYLTYRNLDWKVSHGFTAHSHSCPGGKHLDEFDLINMNGRVYDPVLGMFLSPDNYVQAPGYAINYNRYSYCFNNPLVYTDPDGEIVWIPIIIGAAYGAYTGAMIGSSNDATGWGMAGYIVGGALIGGLSGGVGSSISTAGGIPLLAGAAGGAVGGAGFSGLATGWNGQAMLQGMFTGAVSGAIGAGFNSILPYQSVGFWNGLIEGSAYGAISGFFSGGATSMLFGGSFLDGAWNGMANGAIMGGIYGSYNGYQLANELGVNPWSGGTLQERGQAWIDYYTGEPGKYCVTVPEGQSDIDRWNTLGGGDFYFWEGGSVTTIDGRVYGSAAAHTGDILFPKHTVRHFRTDGGWAKGVAFHELSHARSWNQSLYRNTEENANLDGLKYGGRSYYRRFSGHIQTHNGFSSYGEYLRQIETLRFFFGL